MDQDWIYKNTQASWVLHCIVLWKHHDLQKLWKACTILNSKRTGEGIDRKPLILHTGQHYGKELSLLTGVGCPYSCDYLRR